MRISEHFSLGRSQPTLDFVDVDVVNDTPLFVDPLSLKLLSSVWASECISIIQNFFKAVISSIQSGDHENARRLLSSLGEPNETHLGLSVGVSHGRGMGNLLAGTVWDALSKSEAAKTGLLEDLEETVLMVPGIDVDIVSDITTNLIRPFLIRYTQEMCETYGIPLTDDVVSGPLWDPASRSWKVEYARLPTVNDGRLLLVPKGIVRQDLNYNPDKYFRDYIIPHLQREEISANSSLVQVLKKGGVRVTKKSVKEKYGFGKAVNARETLRNPAILKRYREEVKRHISPPLSHSELAAIEGSVLPDWDALIGEVQQTQVGNAEADRYEKAIEALLSALFYPALTNPHVQHELHSGRKRIDISYVNVMSNGFFHWLGSHYPAQMVFVECKNYSDDPANPEIDQLSGRFGPSRGKFGFLVCRKIENKTLLLQRCKDTAVDDRGFMIPLDDEDVFELVKAKQQGGDQALFEKLKAKFDHLIM
ncbi:MAG: hypothetical protein AAB473_01115 [Patescibacteria group bacterium]